MSKSICAEDVFDLPLGLPKDTLREARPYVKPAIVEEATFEAMSLLCLGKIPNILHIGCLPPNS